MAKSGEYVRDTTYLDGRITADGRDGSPVAPGRYRLVGARACPFTAGYWQWVHRHQDLLASNNRTARAVATMNKLGDLDAVLEQESAREQF